MTDRVLIVDDSLTVRMDLASAFEAGGFEPVPCATAAEARRVLANDRVDVVVLDVMLPDADGIEFLQELRACPEHDAKAILMLSTEADVKDRVRGLRTGADEYVGKPYDAGYVVAKARQLRRSRLPASVSTTVLLIDDSLTFRSELQHTLQAAGYTILTAADGEEGLRIAADRRPAAIIVDGVLPGIDGATVIRRVRLDTALRGVPCLLLTASTDRDAELRVLDAGADAFVRKEDDMTVVLARLAAVLRQADTDAPAAGTVSLHGPKKILAVDDSTTFLQAIGSSLRDEGYEVVLAQSGQEALDLLAAQTVDCILLDLLMPGLDGRETCQRIKAVPAVRDIPLIMMTAVDDAEAMLDGLSVGADDYIRKSDEMEVLRARVRAQIRRKQFQDENRRIREELLRRDLEAAEARAARQLAETRAALVDELQQKNNELEAFSYSVSHDLRSPLNVVEVLSTTLMEDYADRLDDTARHQLQLVHSAATRMIDLVNALLQLSQATRAGVTRHRVDLSALVREVVEELSQAEPDRAITLVVQDGMVAEVDPGLIRVLMVNLLANAVKFTRRADSPTIVVGSRRENDDTVYFVQDNGAGFEAGSAALLFRPFSRLHNDPVFPGTGIGLATVYRIVDRHTGRIWAEGATGRGATFYFTVEPSRTPQPEEPQVVG
ncbi:MAG TPA: response regulator [Rugosimonospora sp.]|nr:response regulator [Rugosimonospora sp.]